MSAAWLCFWVWLGVALGVFGALGFSHGKRTIAARKGLAALLWPLVIVTAVLCFPFVLAIEAGRAMKGDK